MRRMNDALRPRDALGARPSAQRRVWLGRELEYVELISVVDLEAWQHGPRGPFAASREAAMLAGGGALQFAFEVDDVAAVVADVRRRGVVMRDPAAGSIRYPSGNTAAWVDEGPGWRPFFIRYPTQHSDRFAIRNPRITQIML